MVSFTPGPERYPMLDSVRGLAALWVVLFHLTLHIEPPSGPLANLLWVNILGRGLLGVPIFFVLSGFVIAHSLRRGFTGSTSVGGFVLRRVVRLTPPYWAAIGLALAMHAIASLVNNEPYQPGGSPLTGGRLVSHLLYGQELLGYLNINDVFWTLAVEMQFYLVAIPVVLLASAGGRRSGDRFYVVVTLGVGFLSLLGTLTPGDGRAVTFIPFFYSFFFGMAAYWVHVGRVAAGWLGLVIAPFIVVGWLHRDRQFMYACVLATVLLVAAARGNVLDRWLCGRTLRALGSISYSLYLVHVPVQGAVVVATTKALGGGTVAVIVGAASSLVLSVVASAAFWLVFEQPASVWSKRLKRPGPTINLQDSGAATLPH